MSWLDSARTVVARNGFGCVDKDTGVLLDRAPEFPLVGDDAWCFRDRSETSEPVRAKLLQCRDVGGGPEDTRYRQWRCRLETGEEFVLEEKWVRPTFVLLDLTTAAALVKFDTLLAKAENRDRWHAMDIVQAVDVMWETLDRARSRRTG